MTRRGRLLVVCLWVAGAAAGCSVVPDAPPPAAHHDLGPVPDLAQFPELPPGIVLSGVTAPDWLNTTEIHYRRLHEEPTRLRAYGRSRWIAPPAALVEQRLRAILARRQNDAASEGHEALVPRLTWAIAVETFEQRFVSERRAAVLMRVRAELNASDPPRTARSETFSIQRSCPPNVQGALSGLSALAHEMMLEVLSWLQRSAPTMLARDRGF